MALSRYLPLRTLLLSLFLAGAVGAESLRQEILLDHADADILMKFLRSQYLGVEFTRHPTMNGFYVLGPRHDVPQIKAEVPHLDRVPPPPDPPQREVVSVRFGDPREVAALLETLVPEVEYEVDEERFTITLSGSPGALDQVKELLQE